MSAVLSATPDEAAPLLSVCMIVKNEEANLARALASAAGLDAELVVVDTGSTDGTVEVALRAGARVLHFPWIDDFSAARNFAFAAARGRWLLVLDADEELSAELRARVSGVLEQSAAGAIRVPVSNVDERGGLRMRAPSVRIVRGGRGYAYEGRVHEQIETSLTRAGGAIEDAELPLVHHGYTPAEDARKQRPERNMRLLVAAQEAAPSDPRHWHYLGLQHAIAGDHEAAALWFERMLAEHPEHELAGWSASQLASIRLSERALGAAWEAARRGGEARLGRVPSLLSLGEITLRDGDARAALACAAALAKLPAQVVGDCERRREATTILHARATAAEAEAEGGNARPAYGVLVRAVKKQPEDAGLADALVKMAERLDASGRANVTAAKDASGARSVIAAGMGTFVRRRAFAHALTLGEAQDVRNEYFAQALWRCGRVEEAREVLVSFGESAAAQLLVCALEVGEHGGEDARAMERALAWMPPKAAEAASHVVARRRVPQELAWLVLSWMEAAIGLRSDAVAERLALSLPGTASESRATHALLRYEGGEPMDALRIALTCAEEPDACEVIGLVAHESGDMAASAAMLSRRARAGDVSVRLALRGSAALRALGDRAAAERLLELGRASRPHAPSLHR
jgi:tetratricopeptide (TPR) repeat protein